MTYNEIPPKAGILYALEVPENQGNTHFANMTYAYNQLSERLKNKINDNTSVNILALVYTMFECKERLKC